LSLCGPICTLKEKGELFMAKKKVAKKKVAKKKVTKKKVAKKKIQKKSSTKDLEYKIIPHEALYASVGESPKYGHMVKVIHLIYEIDKATGQVTTHGLTLETSSIDQKFNTVTGKEARDLLNEYEKVTEDDSPFNTWVPSTPDDIGPAILELLNKFDEIEEDEEESIGMAGGVKEAIEKLATSFYVNMGDNAEKLINESLSTARKRADEIIKEMEEEEKEDDF
jgi:hypothetical protein